MSWFNKFVPPINDPSYSKKPFGLFIQSSVIIQLGLYGIYFKTLDN